MLGGVGVGRCSDTGRGRRSGRADGLAALLAELRASRQLDAAAPTRKGQPATTLQAELGVAGVLVLALGTAAHASSFNSASACSSQNRTSISRYIAVAVERCSCASCRLPRRR